MRPRAGAQPPRSSGSKLSAGAGRGFRDDFVTMAHGAGGKALAALIDAVFLDAFGGLREAAPHRRSPDHSPSRGDCRVHNGLVRRQTPSISWGFYRPARRARDGKRLAVMGARPQWLSAAFVIEEGFAINQLREVVADMSDAAREAGVSIVTGDTKVVGRGAADGMYVTTAGNRSVPAGRRLGAGLVQRGDRIVVSGTIADHGMAVMLARGDLALEADLRSDTAPVNELVEVLFAAAPSTRWMRDPTRGGVGTVCNELAHDSGLAVVLDESALPIKPAVAGACDLLGIDPLYVANEGKLLAVVSAKEADAAVEALRGHRLGLEAAIIGDIRGIRKASSC